MGDMPATRCERCGDFIVFVRTIKGKWMPCNQRMVAYIKNPEGKHQILTKGGELVRCDFTDNVEWATGFGYVPHFGSCEGFKKKSDAPPKQYTAGVNSIVYTPKPKEEKKKEQGMEQLALFEVHNPREVLR